VIAPEPAEAATLERRVLVLTPTSRDAALTEEILGRAGAVCVACANLEAMCAELEGGASAMLLPEEAVVLERDGCLSRWLAAQPPWSDLPVLVLARPGADSSAVAQAMDLLGNVTVLERPTRVAALVSAVRTALRARQRQYQIRDHLIERERAEVALRDSDRRKDEFLAILAHELRNPLAPIRNSLHILRLGGGGDPMAPTAPGARAAPADVTAMIERQVNYMVRLVDDLMEVSRISRGKVELRKEPVELSAIVHGAVETSRPQIEAGGHELTLALPAEPLTLDGDFVRLTQVLANLLNNAAKYSDPGGRIRVVARREGSEAVLAVSDTGRGIPADMLPRVFEPFLQVEREPSRVQGGLGIGLTLVRSLVELHGGRVEAKSGGAGRGSEFVVRLPLGAGDAAASVAAPKRRPSKMLASRRVLVVDDNRDAAQSLGMLLRMFGADVRVAYSGVEALETFAADRPTIVLLDIGMPGMDGHEVARRIRRQTEPHAVTLIALTGWGQEEDRQASEDAGFDHHLIKPADVDVLQELLASL
jgi:signal transduction histidine kinase/CheY-like chemotaxis protein